VPPVEESPIVTAVPVPPVPLTAAPISDLLARLPAEPERDNDAILDAFLGFVTARGLTLYPAQEEAVLELLAGKHVVLNTPTGSGKSLVATALLFRALAFDERAFYTFPIKALASEKFFELCELLGPQNVGMLTGDASINRDAPIICATAEILANVALRDAAASDISCVVMDEFHYYGDPDRGMAWQIPLLLLNDTQFLLMSATLGDVSAVTEDLQVRTGREVAIVRSDERPVPLDFVYRETPLHETVRELFEGARTPAYVVSFTQRECAELAQGLTSFELCSKPQKEKINQSIAGFRFDSPYGSDVKRFLRHGIGIHHAGLLPKYRRLMERLARAGLLTVICGTDTLGVGVNVPIRSVCFTKLCKFDGTQVKRLSVREFKQIAGRAGRKGYDVRGSVVCQAPEHVIENRVIDAKSAAGKKGKIVRKKPPDRGYVHWDETIFRQLIERPPEPLQSQFKVSHGMLLQLLRSHGEERRGGYGALIELIARSHERPVIKGRLKLESKQLFQSLRAAAVIEVWPHQGRPGCDVRVSELLQRDFSLHSSLSLYLVETLAQLEPALPSYALDVLSVCEAVLEHPRPVLYAQERRAKDELIAKLKAEGVEYDERMAELERVSYPKPNAEFIYDTFNAYARKHPWLDADNIRPKAVARDMFEGYASFSEYIKRYGLPGSEGVLLRYLSEVYKTLVQSVPAAYYSDDLTDIVSYLRATLQRVDNTLVQEWESMLAGGAVEVPEEEAPAYDVIHDAKALRAMIRADLHLLVKALSQRDYAEAALLVRGEPDEPWTEERLARALEPFYAEHERIVFDSASRRNDKTIITELAPHLYRVQQILVDPAEDNTWFLEGEVDVRAGLNRDEPLLGLKEIRA
jgi:superfamily II RNA helicase